MKVEVVNKLTTDIYKEAKKLNGYSFYHTQYWHDFLKKTFGWKTKAVVVYQNNKLKLFLPYLSKYRYFLYKKNISLPFSHKVAVAYDKEYKDLLKSISLPLNNIEIHDEVKHHEFYYRHDNDITKLDLSNYECEDTLFKSFHYKSIRYMINRAKKQDFEILNTPTQETINSFYSLELETRHRQGAPIYPVRFFENLFNIVPNDMLSIFVVKYNNKPIAGSIFFHYNNETVYAYSASVSDRDIKKLGANELTLWNGIQTAYRKGHKSFDFGTTPIHLQGLKKYKEKWNGESYPLFYSYFNKKKQKDISRTGDAVSLVSTVLRNMPITMFKHISPVLLKIAI